MIPKFPSFSGLLGWAVPLAIALAGVGISLVWPRGHDSSRQATEIGRPTLSIPDQQLSVGSKWTSEQIVLPLDISNNTESEGVESDDLVFLESLSDRAFELLSLRTSSTAISARAELGSHTRGNAFV